MPRSVGNNAVLEVTLVQQMNNQVLLNVLHYRLSATGIADGDDITDVMDNTVFGGLGSFIGDWKNINAATWRLNHVKYQWVWPTRFTSTISTDEAGIGSSGAAPLPQNVAAVLTKKSLLATRPGIGSVHLGGLTVDDVENGSLTALRIPQLIQMGAQLTQVIDVTAVPNATEMVPIIGPQTDVANAPRWEDYIVQATSRIMRRRTVGLGI